MLELLLFSIITLPFVLELAHDPSPGLIRTVSESRTIECKAITKEEAEKEQKLAPKDAPRASYFQESFAQCEHRIFQPGERTAREEEILSRLTEQSNAIAALAGDLKPTPERWLVVVHYPDAMASRKIDVAVKVALKDKEMPVQNSSRFSDFSPYKSNNETKTSCSQHYKLQPEDGALLSVVLTNVEETNLHAGVCYQGRWQWLL